MNTNTESVNISPIEAVKALTPDWMLNIRAFDGLEIQPCAVVHRHENGIESVEPCERDRAEFWTVYGHYKTGGVEAFEDKPTEAEAIAFRDLLLNAYPHLKA